MKKLSAAKIFERFALSGFKPGLLTNELYSTLSRSFGFIAHYNREGFYAARFGTARARAMTFEVMAQTVTWRTLTPFEKSLLKIVGKRKLFAAAVREHEAEIEKGERAELARLKTKYETA